MPSRSRPVPAAPPVLLGTIDVSGATVPVYDLSRRPRSPAQIALEDKLLLLRTACARRALGE